MGKRKIVFIVAFSLMASVITGSSLVMASSQNVPYMGSNDMYSYAYEGEIDEYVAAEDYEYLIEDADKKFLTEADIGTMPIQVACYAKNEIYARHGRKFVSHELQEYFDRQPWYHGRIEAYNFDEDKMLNRFEKENAYLLTVREKALSYNGKGYVLDEMDYTDDINFVENWLENSKNETYNIMSNAKVYSNSGSAYISTDYFLITCPENPKWSWIQLDNTSFKIYYNPAKKAGYGGNVVTIRAYDAGDTSYENLPSWRVCGRSYNKTYVAILPTDVQFDASSKNQAEAYRILSEWANTLDENNGGKTFTIK